MHRSKQYIRVLLNEVIRIDTITKRLFFSFGILLFNIIIISVLSLFFLWRDNAISKIGQQISNQRIFITQLIKTDLDFLRFETVNSNFYLTGKSPLLNYRDRLYKRIQHDHIFLQQEMVAHDFVIDYQFHVMDSLIERYNTSFVRLIQKINARGFKDYGLEGTMRDHAHQLESMSDVIAARDLLTLRRHEKDFLLRKEEHYVDLFNQLCDNLLRSPAVKSDQQVTGILQDYQHAFNSLVKINFEIGITHTAGILGQLNQNSIAISHQLEHLTILSEKRKDEIMQRSAWLFALITLLTFIFSLLLTYYTSTRLARPIKKLSLSMGKFIVNEGLDERELENETITNEINNLSQSFIKMSRKLKTQFNEIQLQNKELKKLNDELDRFIYSAAHDLKSPLASLEGLIRLAEIEVNSPKHAHYFQMMTKSLKKLNGFINDITDYAKNKRQQLKIEMIDIRQLATGIIESVKFLPYADKIAITITVEGAEYFSDKARLEIVFKNLISNSFRYMDFTKSNPFIKINGTVTEENLRITITDNGIGIGKQHLNKIFDMFYRAVEHSQGTGIGLFLVKESVKMLGGRISVKSSLGEWTVFQLVIPNLKKGADIPESEVVIQNEYFQEEKVSPGI